MSSENQKKLRVLVIDDDPFVRSFICDMGEDLNWNISAEDNGLDGLEVIRTSSNPFDIVLLDVRMPGVSGMEILPELIKYSLDLPVIMMSGYSELGTAVDSMKYGCIRFFAKAPGHRYPGNQSQKCDLSKCIKKRTSAICSGYRKQGQRADNGTGTCKKSSNFWIG